MTPEQTSWEQFRPRYEKLERDPLTTENVSNWLHDSSELSKEVEEAFAGTFRAKNENTADKAAETAFLLFVQEIAPHTEAADQKLKLKLLALDGFTPEHDQTEFVRRFRSGAELFRDANVPLFADEETLSSEFGKLTGELTLELDGETLTIPEAEKRLREPDRALRERAWRAIKEAELSVSSELDTLFLKLLKLRRKIAKNTGLNYRDFRWRALNRFDYTPEDSCYFHDAIAAEVTPLNKLHSPTTLPRPD